MGKECLLEVAAVSDDGVLQPEHEAVGLRRPNSSRVRLDPEGHEAEDDRRSEEGDFLDPQPVPVRRCTADVAGLLRMTGQGPAIEKQQHERQRDQHGLAE